MLLPIHYISNVWYKGLYVTFLLLDLPPIDKMEEEEEEEEIQDSGIKFF